jgi:flavin-dependent dehydrogenase
LVEVANGTTNLCCWVEAEEFRRTGGTPHGFLASALRENLHLWFRLQGIARVGTAWTTTGFMSGKTVAPVVSDVWNIGDCAAMVAPLTGDGMGMGLRAAELAATTMLEVFRQGAPWSLATAEYIRRWQGEFRPRLRWGRVLEALLLHPRLALCACEVLHWVPRLLPGLYRRTRQSVPTDSFAVETYSQRPHSRRSLRAR